MIPGHGHIFSQFETNLSQSAAPLRTLLEDDIEWHWTEQQLTSLEAL